MLFRNKSTAKHDNYANLLIISELKNQNSAGPEVCRTVKSDILVNRIQIWERRGVALL